MSRPQIFVTSQYPRIFFESVKNKFSEFDWIRGDEGELYSKSHRDIMGLCVRSQNKVDDKLLKHLPNLKSVVTATSGFDHFQISEIQNSKLALFYTPDCNAQSTAELSFWHILSAVKKTNLLTQKSWKTPSLMGEQLAGKNLGILGLGRIGKKVAQMGEVFGCEVHYYDPYVQNTHFESLGLMEIFRLSDYISLHLPLTPKTKHIINSRTLAEAGFGLKIINCARGELIRSADLLQALNEGVVSRVSLDCFEEEPLSANSAFRSHPKVNWTPHIGAYTEEAFKNSCVSAMSGLAQQLSDEEGHGLTPLPFNTLWWQEAHS